MRIALAQINPTVGDLKGNRKKILEFVHRAKGQEADIIAFPELALCGYPPEDLLLKEHFVRDNLKILQSLVKEIKGITAIIGYVDCDQKKNLYNAAAIIADGKIKDVYHKNALPNYGVFDEKRYFQSKAKPQVFSIAGIKAAVNICEDIWVERGIYLDQVKKGAKVLINISSSPYDVDKLAKRGKLLKLRARQTKAYFCYVNLVGGQDELVFDGNSMVVSPQGRVMAMAKSFEEDLLVVDLPVGNKDNKKSLPVSSRSPVNFVEEMYKALVLATRDYIEKNGFKKVLIGLSGGIDSALVAAIAVDAIGKDNVVGVSMPSRYSSTATCADAKQMAENLRIQFKEIPIEEIVHGYDKALEKEFKELEPNIAEENIQARIRGNILMALSNKFGWLVLTTGNKSEFAVGYCTLYGDMSGGYAVIKDVFKTKVYELARWRNSQGQDIIPQSVIDRAPTAELRENQKDQDSLPEYALLDKILADYVDQHKSPAQLVKKYNKEVVEKVMRLVDCSEYKRRQAAPGVKITQRAFGKDWRLPITNRYKKL